MTWEGFIENSIFGKDIKEMRVGHAELQRRAVQTEEKTRGKSLRWQHVLFVFLSNSEEAIMTRVEEMKLVRSKGLSGILHPI